MNRILVVDDEKMVRFGFCEILTLNGFSPVEVSGGMEAVSSFREERPDAVLLDLKMPGMDGIETLRELKKIDPDVPVIIVTSHGDVPTAVEAIKLGAYDFLLKPPEFDSLVLLLKRAVEKRELERKLKNLHGVIETSIECFLGESRMIRDVVGQIQRVAGSDFSIIIQGETGTGKTHIANLIHTLSGRAKGPFVTVDMGAIPETLVESELFGHEKGAFTGAERRKKGYFETADGGTIFIDEIQNVPPHIQSKLLRVVEEKNIHTVGGDRPLDIDIRIIAATNTDLQAAVKEKRFREDLYFRLCEFLISIPPLRDRREDILFLVRKFCQEAAAELKKQVPEISEEALGLLQTHAWPGNIRELKNVVKRSVLLSDSNFITPEHIVFLSADKEERPSAPVLTGMSLPELEKAAIIQTLEQTGGNKSKAATLLQIDYTTLHRKIKQYRILP